MLRGEKKREKALNEVFLSETYISTWQQLSLIFRYKFALQLSVFIGFMIIYALRELIDNSRERKEATETGKKTLLI